MNSIGIDIGGTKIAGAIFDDTGQELAKYVKPTPNNYNELVDACIALVLLLEKAVGMRATVGIGVPGAIDKTSGKLYFAANTPCLIDAPLRQDLTSKLGRPVYMANDADCAALSEATDGAGAGYHNVFGLILGTGVGGGAVINGNPLQGVNGLTGEFGHLALPFREKSDGPMAECHCGQKGCIDKSVSGPALVRLYSDITNKYASAETIASLAKEKNPEACQVLDAYCTTLSKAIIPIIQTFDPDVIIVSGGLSELPVIYDEVPKRWGKFSVRKDLKTLFMPAKYGAATGLRGAAWIGRG
jgi:fructokinase